MHRNPISHDQGFYLTKLSRVLIYYKIHENKSHEFRCILKHIYNNYLLLSIIPLKVWKFMFSQLQKFDDVTVKVL